jgi:hypothetical protein
MTKKWVISKQNDSNLFSGLVHIESGWIGIIGKDGNIQEYQNIHKASGTVTFKKPVKPQEYKIKLFWENSSVGESEAIHIEGKDILNVSVEKKTVTATISIVTFDLNSVWAWVALYKAGETDLKKYLESRYVGDGTAPISFENVKQGHYVVKVFPSYSSYEAILEQNVTIE